MKTTYITILVLSLSAAGCSAMLEFKDYGNNNNPNPDCGNGVLNAGEECDDGEDNSDESPNACRKNCMNAHCGDNVTDTGEQCDSGEQNGQPDRCNETCSGYVGTAECGNGVVDPGEECDGVQGTQCEEHGYVQGTGMCKADCTLDVESCESPQGCVPAADLACDSGVVLGSTLGIGSRNNFRTQCTNSSDYYSGREIVYSYMSDERRLVRLRLNGLGGNQDLLVIEDNGAGVDACMDTTCVTAGVRMGSSEEVVSFVAMAFVRYLIIVEGRDGYNGDFELAVECPPAEDCTGGTDANFNGLYGCDDPDCVGTPVCNGGQETNCEDGLDNDGDGQIDCHDNDCVSVGACSCNASDTLQCGDVLDSSNFGPSSTNQFVTGWCGHAFMGTTGPEHFYKLVLQSPLPTTVTVLVSNMTADVDTFILEGDNNNCYVGNCVPGTSNPTGGLADEQNSFSPVSGVIYYLAVDGWMWSMADYRITVTCD